MEPDANLCRNFSDQQIYQILCNIEQCFYQNILETATIIDRAQCLHIIKISL